MRVLCRLIAVALLAGAVASPSQTLREQYRQAATLGKLYSESTVGVPGAPVWIGESDSFWYRRSVVGGHAFVLVDAATGSRGPAFDQEKLAAAYNRAANGGAANEKVTGLTLPFTTFQFVDGRTRITFTVNGTNWKCTLAGPVCASTGEDTPWYAQPLSAEPMNDPAKTVASPDGRWVAWVENFNVFVRKTPGGAPVALSTDGSQGDFYQLDSIRWSPDSKELVAYRLTPGFRRHIHYVQAAPADQLQPVSSSIEYEKPGDVLDREQPVLFRVDPAQELAVDPALFPNPFTLSEAQWWKDSRGFTFEYNQRGHQAYRIVQVDRNGHATVLISETSDTFIDYPRVTGDQEDTGWTYRDDLDDGREILWMSERDGWPHLYLYNGLTGAVEHQVTRGQWVVRDVSFVDEARRQIYFEASGMSPGEDPYFVHGYRIGFDGTGLTPLTPEAGNHALVFSHDGRYFVDTWSTPGDAPTMVLRRTADDSIAMHLEHGDLSRLVAAGWQPPLVFHAPGRDGRTPIWGLIWKPLGFDPHRKYPVVEDIYAGPQGSFVPKSFSTRFQPLTALGFVVVQIDGMGTNNRGKAFHDVAWKDLKDAGFPDRILWHKAAAAEFPWYDIGDGVGIFGTSAGGQSTLSGLLFHPEFYKVGVANSGCYDNRMDKIWWNELWMGWPVGPQYAASSGVVNAYRLQGRLMLVMGGMDHNVDPSSTLQVVNALVQANKDFTLLEVPNGDHGAGGAYGQRRLEDFFVTNMRHQVPPPWNAEPGSWFRPSDGR